MVGRIFRELVRCYNHRRQRLALSRLGHCCVLVNPRSQALSLTRARSTRYIFAMQVAFNGYRIAYADFSTALNGLSTSCFTIFQKDLHYQELTSLFINGLYSRASGAQSEIQQNRIGAEVTRPTTIRYISHIGEDGINPNKC